MSRLIKKFFAFLCVFFGLCYLGLIIYAYLPYEEVPLAELATPMDQFIEVDGKQIRYRDYSEGDSIKPNLILMHGFGNTLNTWRHIVPELQKYYRVIAIDLIGFGLSSKPVNYDYGNQNQARTIGLFARNLNLDSFIIGGHSLGGAIAVHVALHNETTTGMILFNPGIITTGVPEITRYLNLIFPFARVSAKQFTKRDFREAFLKRSFIHPSIVTDEVVDEIMLGVRSEGYMDGTTSMMSKYYVANELELLPSLGLPTLIIFGQEDRTKSIDEAIALNENIKGSKLHLIENAGHYVHEEAPEKVTKKIIKEINYLSAQGKIET